MDAKIVIVLYKENSKQKIQCPDCFSFLYQIIGRQHIMSRPPSFLRIKVHIEINFCCWFIYWRAWNVDVQVDPLFCFVVQTNSRNHICQFTALFRHWGILEGMQCHDFYWDWIEKSSNWSSVGKTKFHLPTQRPLIIPVLPFSIWRGLWEVLLHVLCFWLRFHRKGF